MELRHVRIRKSFEDFTSLFFALAVIFGIAIFFIVLSYTYDRVEPKLEEGLSGAATPEAGSNSTGILSKTGNSIRKFNVLFPFLLIGVFGFVMVSALMARSHPAFLFIGLIVLGVVLILGAIFSNVYEELSSHPEFASTDANFGIMGLFLSNLPIVLLILFVGIAIILYTKGGGSGSQPI